ncbi:MAG: hypothetical protein HFI39_11975 [Lachnospiraceae bacterium]|nr:hypothetical protein [Lachnospiraceae bacterium]
MPIQPDHRYYMKLKALYYLYEKNYTQTDIAKLLHISRVTLGKLLEEARNEGMIKIEIVDVRGSMQILQMEEQLKQRFGLQDIKLADCQSQQLAPEAVLRRIASEAATYFEHQLQDRMKLGFTWGRTLNAMVDQLPDNHSIHDLTVYTLVGGSSSSADFQPNILVQKMIQKYGGSSHIITAPFMCQSAALCHALKQEPQIASILEASLSLDLTMVGIGEAPLRGAGHLSDYPFDAAMINELVEAGAVGDICGNFFDIRGRLCDTSLRDRIVSIDLRELHRHRKVIGVGGGPAKVKSVLGALNGHYLDVLITDVQTAAQVLELADSFS